MENKICIKCKLSKAPEDFPSKERGNVCRECRKKSQRDSYARKRAAGRKLWTSRAAQLAITEAQSVPCADCHRRYPPYVMEFDHRPGEVRAFHVTSSRSGEAATKAEIAKCDVVCLNCLRIRKVKRGASVASIAAVRRTGVKA